MQRLARVALSLVAVLSIGGLFALPMFVPHENRLASITARSQTAQADDAWWGDYQMGFDSADTYSTSDVLSGMYADQGYGSGGWDPSSPERSPESQAYIDQHGYGWAPCMDSGTCDSGSLKDSPSDSYYYDTWSYDEPYPAQEYYYDDYGYYDTYDYGYAQQTGSYISAGLAQVPIILTNTVAPQSYSVSYPSYVQQPVQTIYTYAQPQTYAYSQPQTYSYQQPTYSFQSSGTMEPAPVIQAQQYEYVQAQPQQFAAPQAIQVPQASAQQSAQITNISYVSMPQTVAQPTQTTRAGFFVASQPATQVSTTQTTYTAPSEPPAPKASCSITAKPARIAAGATTTISWEAKNASAAKLAPVGGTVALVGSTTVRVSTTTSFTLSVSGNAGEATCVTQIAIDPTMCLPGCPPGFVCTPIEATPEPAETAKKSGFWSWLGF